MATAHCHGLKVYQQSKDAFFAAAEVFDNEEVDVAIVGAGPAGSLMAYLLAEQHGKSETYFGKCCRVGCFGIKIAIGFELMFSGPMGGDRLFFRRQLGVARGQSPTT
eukprot:g10734.t1